METGETETRWETKARQKQDCRLKKAQSLIKQLIMGHSALQLLKLMLTIYIHLSGAF